MTYELVHWRKVNFYLIEVMQYATFSTNEGGVAGYKVNGATQYYMLVSIPQLASSMDSHGQVDVHVVGSTSALHGVQWLHSSPKHFNYMHTRNGTYIFRCRSELDMAETALGVLTNKYKSKNTEYQHTNTWSK